MKIKKMIALVFASAITCGIYSIDDLFNSPCSKNSKTAAYAADADKNTTVPAATTTEASPTSAPLTAGVQKVDLSLEKLRDLGLDLKQVSTSARHLFDEVSIQPVSLNTMPEVVGRGTIIYIPVSTSPAGPPVPPNPRRVEQAMNIMRPIINTLKQNADEFVQQHQVLDVSDESKEKLRPIVKSWVESATNIAGNLAKLEPLTKGPSYDNVAIAGVCKNIQQDAFILDKLRRNAYKIIKKEEKAKTKNS